MLGNVILTAEEIPFGAESDVDEELKRLETDKADKDNVLELDNTTAYTPTADYHPCTKAYTDSGLATKADVASLSSNNIVNDSEVDGEDITDALNTLKNETDEVLNFTPTNYTPTEQTLKGYFEGLDDGLENYTKTYTTMPTANADNLGETIQYLGTTTASSYTTYGSYGITDIVVDTDTFENKFDLSGSYPFAYITRWRYFDGTEAIEVDLADYGITFSGTPTSEDIIDIQYTQKFIAPQFYKCVLIDSNYYWVGNVTVKLALYVCTIYRT